MSVYHHKSATALNNDTTDSLPDPTDYSNNLWDINTGVSTTMAASAPLAAAADLGGATSSSGSYESVFATSGNLTFNLEFDTAALNAPAEFRTGVQEAATLLAAAITIKNAATINIAVGYDENGATGGSANAGPTGASTFAYATIRSDLIADAPTGDTNFNALPTGSSDGIYSQVTVWTSEQKALGLLAGNFPVLDGTADFGSGISTSSLVGVALHELAHAMGRVPAGGTPDVFDLFRFTSAGTILVDDSTPATSAAYFSVDGGVTRLADYGIHSDPSDFLNSTAIDGDAASPLTPEDPFNQYYDSNTIQTLTAADLVQLDVLGFGTACYCAGTLILTDQGEVAVQDLRPGMHVVTEAGLARPVRWVGWRRVDCTRHPDPTSVRPIRILANAVDHGMPRNDLRLSPEHAVYIDGLLIPVRLLVNGTTIRQEETCDSTTYYHVELDSHDVLLAEGLPAESYLDTGNRSSFANGGGPVRLYADFAQLAWDGFGFAPLTLTGAALETVRARLGSIAADFAPPTQGATRRFA